MRQADPRYCYRELGTLSQVPPSRDIYTSSPSIEAPRRSYNTVRTVGVFGGVSAKDSHYCCNDNIIVKVVNFCSHPRGPRYSRALSLVITMTDSVIMTWAYKKQMRPPTLFRHHLISNLRLSERYNSQTPQMAGS